MSYCNHLVTRKSGDIFVSYVAHQIDCPNCLQATLSSLNVEIDRLKEQVLFYKRRCNLLQRAQKKFREPERTIVCDILANEDSPALT